VTFSNPPINLIDGAMIVELRELFDMTEKNEGPRVLLFESADRDYFLGGTLETHDFSAFA
jgi:enoyl-CoA hydratase/carnithine racemase